MKNLLGISSTDPSVHHHASWRLQWAARRGDGGASPLVFYGSTLPPFAFWFSCCILGFARWSKIHGSSLLLSSPPVISLLLSLSLAEIHFSEIRSDDRQIIPFDEFGFTHFGRLELNVTNIRLSNLYPDLDRSKIGFFLCTRDSWLHVINQLEDGEVACALQSDLIKPVFTFNDLKKDQNSLSKMVTQNDADQFTLVFANCCASLKVSMDVNFLKGITLFTLIVLIGTGWSFLKPYLQDKEKKVLMIVIPLQVVANIAQVVIDETGPYGQDWITWKQVFLLVDVVCCCAVLFPIVWSIKNLREAARTDGKAAVNLMKLTLFRQYYIVVICYIYFTRVVVYALETITSYKYLWTSVVAGELATLAFYVFTGYKFRPEAHNPYFVVDDDEEEAAAEALKLEDEFEL
uniref:CAND6/7 N-terminal domain-containing protein n=1 Tax=Salix viminalis TaxID=40686 RepID=A0A6N2JXV4_SALVM